MAKRSNVRRLRAEFDANEYFEDATHSPEIDFLENKWDPANDRPKQKKKSRQQHNQQEDSQGHNFATREQHFRKKHYS